MTTEAIGISQGDIIIRTGLVQALRDLRANPWLLDHVFASLPQDTLTAKVYGEKEVAQAKQWFLKTDIPVFMVPRIDEAKVPCISIKLTNSAEAEVTLGDTHYVEREDVEADWPAMTDKFTPTSFNPQTGVMVVPQAIGDSLVIVAGMLVVDANGGTHEITDITDAYTFTIATGPAASFQGSTIKGTQPSETMALESVSYRESYQIGVHVSGEPVYLTWLHSIVVFALLSYKQSLFEARGFERHAFTSSDFDRNEQIESAELVFSRYISMTGYVRQYWPKDRKTKITSFQPQPIRILGNTTSGGVDPNDQLWIGENDTLG